MMEEIFKESVIEKIRQLEEKISSLAEQGSSMDEIKEQQKLLSIIIAELKPCLSQLSKNAEIDETVSKQMGILSGKLDHCTRTLENPTESKEHYIHHFRWPLGVAIGVFLLLVTAVAGLYINHQKLGQYLANDTKYRSLKLIEDKGLEGLLNAEDSVYLTNPNMRKTVKELEAKHEKKLELFRQAREKQWEAEELKKKAMK